MNPLMGLGPLARMAFAGGDLGPVKASLLDRVARDENDANALLDLSTVLQLMGQRQCGLAVQAMAVDLRQLYRVGDAGDGGGIRLLALVTPGDLAENNALEFLVEGSDISLDLLYVAPDLPFPEAVPEHDVAMVAVCESDRNRRRLQHIASLVKSWPRPVVCAPDRIARLSRDGVCQVLGWAPGMAVPATRRIDRGTLEALGDGGFPLIIRPVDSQKGCGLRRLDRPEGVADYLLGRPEKAFYVAPYVEYAGPDGQYRKYRIVLIDRRPYACHMAISDRWVVHYMSAGMEESAAKRAEEERFFSGFDDEFARRHHAALAAIAERIELEYVGIDCGETPRGELLIFEVDSGMTVHAMDPAGLFPYKAPQMRKVFGAFHQMLREAAGK